MPKILVVDDELFTRARVSPAEGGVDDQFSNLEIKLIGQPLEKKEEEFVLADGIKNIFLGQEGYELLFAQDYKKAENTARENLNIEVVLMDIRMPNVDGFTLVERLRKISPFMEFIMITAYNFPEYRQSALERAVDFITKPIDDNALLAAVERARARYHGRINEYVRRTLEMARRIQQRLLPELPSQIPGISFSAKTNPADEIGGDGYAITRFSDGTFGALIADVSSHGPGPALIASAFAKAAEIITPYLSSPKEAMERLTQSFAEPISSEGSFITALYTHINRGDLTLQWYNAGHYGVLIYRPSTNELFELGGEKDDPTRELPIGAPQEKEVVYTPSQKFQLKKGDKIIMYTDCFVEGENMEGKPYGQERFFKSIEENGKLPVKEFERKVFREFEEFLGGAKRKDDITLVTLQIEPN